MRKIVKFITSKTIILGMFFLLQISFLVFLLYKLKDESFIGVYIHVGLLIASFFVILHLLSSNINIEFKIAWILPITIFPIFGTFFYLFYTSHTIRPRKLKKYIKTINKRQEIFNLDKDDLGFKELYYLKNIKWPHFKHTKTTYIDSGEEKLEMLIEDLKKAEKFIFVEYFIITKGYMFDKIFDVLKEKAEQGVIVKVLYDDFGCADKLPFRFKKKMKEANIEAVPFNKMTLHVNFALNYRDHKKIVIIDNKIGYTGGVNIGDEYINKQKRFGHWKDSAIKVEGKAVSSMTISFLETYNFSSKTPLFYDDFAVDYEVDSDEIVAPFVDSPMEKHRVMKSLLLYLINEAKEVINITTPYLILDEETRTALRLAAQSGVEVNIVIPGIPDKRFVYLVTEHNAHDLSVSGVNIYKYMEGFVHSKMFVIDNEKAIIGTSNLDFRSLYLHFENNIYLYNSDSINDINNSIKNTIELSNLETPKTLVKKRFIGRVIQATLKGFASIL